MNEKTVVNVHWSFWVIGAVALIWNGMGVLNYFMQMNADALATYPAAERRDCRRPARRATGAFAIAVFGGTAW